MARLDLAATRRKRNIALLSFWLSMMQLTNWFWLIVVKHVEYRVNSMNLRPRYQYAFYERREYINKIIYASDSACRNTTRMNRETFVRLCTRLEATGKISSTKNMLVDEQVAVTLHILAHHQKQRTIGNNFERSGETISRHFRQVINSIVSIQRELLKKPEPVPNDSTDERWKWFKVCCFI